MGLTGIQGPTHHYPGLLLAKPKDPLLTTPLDPTWAKLVRTLVDGGQCLADLVGQWVFGGHGVAAGIDLDGAVAA